ncbi:MAG: efflux RND transporter permease subunit, partial [Halobacteriota archaeon]
MDWRSWDSAVADVIVERPRSVVIAFVLVTLVFGVGLAGVSTDAGTEQFTEDLPEFEAIERVQEEFSGPFETSTGSTQLIQTGENVVSQRGLLRMLRVQEALEANPDLRVDSTGSPASTVAQRVDPTATSAESQVRALEGASDAEVREIVRSLEDTPSFTRSLSTDFNPTEPEAGAALGVVDHDIETGVSAGPEGGGGEMSGVQRQAEYAAESVDGDVRVFGSGIVNEEFNSIVGDSLSIVIPAAVLLIILFLVVAYRDPIDLVLALGGLLMAIVWTLGFMGFARIPFNETLVSLPPIMLAVGIDFSIHSINRYREERVAGGGIDESMSTASSQLIVAFAIVAGTTSIGFAANLISSFQPTRNFGLVAGVAIVFVLLIFGVFLPAAKVLADRWRRDNGIPEFGSAPLGAEGGRLARVLTLGVRVTRRRPWTWIAVF